MSHAETTRRIDEWIQNWGLRLDETGRFIVSDGRILTTYQRLLIDKNQRAIRERLQEGYRRAWEANESHLRQKALENVIPFIPPPRDTLQARRQPAEDRMDEAYRLLSAAKAKPGWKPEAVWDEMRVSFIGSPNPMPWRVPSCLRMEMLYLLAREERVSFMRSPSMEYVGRSGGGCA